jgi:hypothetical protein
MNLPKAPGNYDSSDQANLRGILEREDKLNQKRSGDFVLQAPNGSRWKLVVDNVGALTTVAA